MLLLLLKEAAWSNKGIKELENNVGWNLLAHVGNTMKPVLVNTTENLSD